MSKKIYRFAARKTGAMTAQAQRYAQARTQAQAQTLTRGARALASAELCNEAIIRFVGLCYEIDPILDDLANVDVATGRILIAVPWGRHHLRFKLTARESRILAAHVMALQSGNLAKRLPPLFVFSPEMRRWMLNLHDHPTQAEAMAYWRKVELTAKKYIAIAQKLRGERV